MSNRKSKAQLTKQAGDFGAVLSRVLVQDVPDPARPAVTIRRAKVWHNYDELHARGGLSDAEHAAARRYSEIVGALVSSGGAPPEGMPRNQSRHGGMAESKVRAAADLRAADGVLGKFQTGLVIEYVVRGHAAEVIGQKQGMGKAQIMARVRGALTRLAEHWA